MSEGKITLKVALIGLVGVIIGSLITAVVKPIVEKKLNQEEKSFHVIVLSTDIDTEAIRGAKQFEQKGYETTVWTSSTGHYAVSLGEYPYKKAHSFRKEVINNGQARSDTYLADPDGLVRVIYPLGNETPKTCFIIVYSNDELKEAKKYSEYLKSKNCKPNPSIRSTSNGKFAVVLGEHKCETARSILERLISDRIVYKDSYVADDGIGKEVSIN